MPKKNFRLIKPYLLYKEDEFNKERYKGDDGGIIKREHGVWVLRDTEGNKLDQDTYRHYLAERNDIHLMD